jgi:YbgC/YbaW family acyl-CoA thioester hydrolase
MVEASAAQHTLFGVERGWSFAIRHRVRWSECEPFGHANHRAYFEWFEEARNRYLEAVGLAALSPNLPGPVIAETSIRYHRPLAYADEILVSARTIRLGRTSFERDRSGRADPGHQCHRGENAAIARAARTHPRPRSVCS